MAADWASGARASQTTSVSGSPGTITVAETEGPTTTVYLIIIFVGLFVVLILAIMLSYWCCRGRATWCQGMNRTE